MLHQFSNFGEDFDARTLKNNLFKLWLLVTTLIGLLRIFALEHYDEITEIIRMTSVGVFCLLIHMKKIVMANKNYEHLLYYFIIASEIVCEIESLKMNVGKEYSKAGAYFMGLLLNTTSYLILNWSSAFLIHTLTTLYYCIRICETLSEGIEFSSQSLFILSLSAYFLYCNQKQNEFISKRMVELKSQNGFFENFIQKYVPTPMVICKSSQSCNLNIAYVNSATYKLFNINEFNQSKKPTLENRNLFEGLKLSEKVILQEKLKAIRFERVKENPFKNSIKENLNPNFEEIFYEVSTSIDLGLAFKEYKASFRENDIISKSNNNDLRKVSYRKEYTVYFPDHSSENEVQGNSESPDEFPNSGSPIHIHSKNNCQVARTFLVKSCRLALGNENAVLFIFNENPDSEFKKVEDKNQLKLHGRLLASASNKLYTHLHLIHTSLDNINEDLNSEDRALRKQVKLCKKSSLLLYYTIGNIFDIFQPNFDFLDTDVNYYKVGPILEEVIYLTKFLAKVKKIKLSASFQQFKDLKLLCNPESLKRILLNLLDNSLKYTPYGGNIRIILNLRTFKTSPSPSLELPYSKQQSYSSAFLQIAVQDDGCGISENLQRDLIKSLSNPDYLYKQGNCIGLLLSQKLIKSMLSSEHHDLCALKLLSLPQIKGSQFSFMIPIGSLTESSSTLLLGTIFRPGSTSVGSATDEFHPEVEISPNLIQRQGRLLNSTRVLVVSDDNSNQKELKENLAKLGINKFETAANGEHAVEKVKEACAKLQPFYFILMDIPVKDGYQASKEITLLASKRVIPETIIIAIIADVGSNSWNYCREVGMRAFLTKPVKKKLLRDTLEAFLGNHLESTFR